MGCCIAALLPRRPSPLGGFGLGALRGRLPAAPGKQGRGLLVQVHYPANTKAPALSAKPFDWFRREVIQEIAKGYKIPLFLLRWLLAGRRQLDPPQKPCESRSTGGVIDCGRGWPIIVFSSGVWGSCEMYTQFCRDLAAAGAIVVAVEHEDGSGLYATSCTTSETIPYVKPPPNVTIPGFRHPFLERHADELGETSAALAWMASAEADDSFASVDPALLEVMRCGDPQRMLLVGHSMGSSGILRYLRRLREEGEPCPFIGSVLLDLWPSPLVEADFAQSVQVPFALILSEMWASTQTYAEGCRKVINKSKSKLLFAASVAGTFHQWISESHLLAPAWLLRRLGIMGTADHNEAYRATVQATQAAVEAILVPTSAADLFHGAREENHEALQAFE